MTPAALKSTLATLGWSARQLGTMLGMSERSPGNWLLGRSAVPPEVAAWLERRAVAHQAYLDSVAHDPPPQMRETPPCD